MLKPNKNTIKISKMHNNMSIKNNILGDFLLPKLFIINNLAIYPFEKTKELFYKNKKKGSNQAANFILGLRKDMFFLNVQVVLQTIRHIQRLFSLFFSKKKKSLCIFFITEYTELKKYFDELNKNFLGLHIFYGASPGKPGIFSNGKVIKKTLLTNNLSYKKPNITLPDYKSIDFAVFAGLNSKKQITKEINKLKFKTINFGEIDLESTNKQPNGHFTIPKYPINLDSAYFIFNLIFCCIYYTQIRSGYVTNQE